MFDKNESFRIYEVFPLLFYLLHEKELLELLFSYLQLVYVTKEVILDVFGLVSQPGSTTSFQA